MHLNSVHINDPNSLNHCDRSDSKTTKTDKRWTTGMTEPIKVNQLRSRCLTKMHLKGS